jgi:hypothetical protein
MFKVPSLAQRLRLSRLGASVICSRGPLLGPHRLRRSDFAAVCVNHVIADVADDTRLEELVICASVLITLEWSEENSRIVSDSVSIDATPRDESKREVAAVKAARCGVRAALTVRVMFARLLRLGMLTTTQWRQRPTLRRALMSLHRHAVSHDPGHEVAADQSQRAAVPDPPRQPLHQHVVVHPVEELRQVHVGHPAPARLDVALRRPHRIVRAAPRPEARSCARRTSRRTRVAVPVARTAG